MATVTPYLNWIQTQIFLMLALMIIYAVPLAIIYFANHKWGKNKISRSKILYILLTLIVMTYLGITILDLIVV